MVSYIIIAVVFILVLTGICLWFFPIYSVWTSRKEGEAEQAKATLMGEAMLTTATFKEKIAVAEASARFKAAAENKKAEIIEAEAVSEAIRVIGSSLQKNDSYLRFQWIKKLDETSNKVVYIPTEAGLPILEAGNLRG